MLKNRLKMIKNNRVMKLKLFALKTSLCCAAAGIIFIRMRAKCPATCVCDELCVSLQMAAALNLEGLPSACAETKASSFVVHCKVIAVSSGLGSVLGHGWDFWALACLPFQRKRRPDLLPERL